MADNTNLALSSELAAFAEQGVNQAREVCDSFLVTSHKVMGHAGRQAESLYEDARQIREMTLGFTDANLTATFDFAARLASARTLEEWSRLQAEFVTEQARRLSDQARELQKAGMAHANTILRDGKL